METTNASGFEPERPVLISDLPVHGGDLQWAEQRFGLPANHFIDLSTGISPWAYPISEEMGLRALNHARSLPDAAYRNLRLSASCYYQCEVEEVLACNGSQSALAAIPSLLKPGVAFVPEPGYKEHEMAWRRAGHDIYRYQKTSDLFEAITHTERPYVCVINPNNPSTRQYTLTRLDALQNVLNRQEESLLVIDEAFIDTSPELSMVHHRRNPNTIVLRSLGKFFGLAGLRVGFAIASPNWIARLSHTQTLWAISHSSAYIAEQALADKEWVAQQRKRLRLQSKEFSLFLKESYPHLKTSAHPLFISIFGNHHSISDVFLTLGKNGVFTRPVFCKHGQSLLRFGLPGDQIDEAMWRITESLGN